MNKKEIRDALKKKGLNFTIVADALEVKPRTIIAVCDRTCTSRRLGKAIAKALGKNVKDVFPDVSSYHLDTPHHVVRKKDRERKVQQLRSLVA